MKMTNMVIFLAILGSALYATAAPLASIPEQVDDDESAMNSFATPSGKQGSRLRGTAAGSDIKSDNMMHIVSDKQEHRSLELTGTIVPDGAINGWKQFSYKQDSSITFVLSGDATDDGTMQIIKWNYDTSRFDLIYSTNKAACVDPGDCYWALPMSDFVLACNTVGVTPLGWYKLTFKKAGATAHAAVTNPAWALTFDGSNEFTPSIVDQNGNWAHYDVSISSPTEKPTNIPLQVKGGDTGKLVFTKWNYDTNQNDVVWEYTDSAITDGAVIEIAASSIWDETVAKGIDPTGWYNVHIVWDGTFGGAKLPNEFHIADHTASPSASPSQFPSSAPSNSPTTIKEDLLADIADLTNRLKALEVKVKNTIPCGEPIIAAPSQYPSSPPSSSPSVSPSIAPSHYPSNSPSSSPSAIPSFVPSLYPSHSPSSSPSANPSSTPSAATLSLWDRGSGICKPSTSGASYDTYQFMTHTSNSLEGHQWNCYTGCMNTRDAMGKGELQGIGSIYEQNNPLLQSECRCYFDLVDPSTGMPRFGDVAFAQFDSSGTSVRCFVVENPCGTQRCSQP